MLTILAFTVASSLATPQCRYWQYLSASVWEAQQNALDNGEPVQVIERLEATLSETYRQERQICGYRK